MSTLLDRLTALDAVNVPAQKFNYITSGSRSARVLIIGSAPSQAEVFRRDVFIGESGKELLKMLAEAGFTRSDCFFTNAVHETPTADIETYILAPKKAPEFYLGKYFMCVHPILYDGIARFEADVAEIKPDIIIALGNVALWVASEGKYNSVSSWRGSQLVRSDGVRYLATYHPTSIIRQWALRYICVRDLRRAKQWIVTNAQPPKYNFIVRPAFDTVIDTLNGLLARADREAFRLSVDIETRAHRIACVGLAWSALDAICIPIMESARTDGLYWPEQDELEVMVLLRRVLTHKNIRVVGQNFAFDAWHFWHYFKFIPHVTDDTMTQQHVLFAGEPKALDFLSSIYCEYHVFWKEDGKFWERGVSEDQLWVYNCTDAVRTFEISGVLDTALTQSNLYERYRERIDSTWWNVMMMQLRGHKIDQAARSKLTMELLEVEQRLSAELTDMIGRDINIRSPKQLQEFFYGELGLKPIIDRKTKRVSTNFETLQKLAEKEPLIWPVVDILLTRRSLGVFATTFLGSRLDDDGCMRSSFNSAGPETYRLSSSQNPFDAGANMQNIPSGDRKKLLYKLPNIRLIYIPDVGYTEFDIDLDRADLQVVVWEANDADLKRQLRIGVDLHIMNGILLAGKEPPPEDELIETHPNYPEHKSRYKVERQLAKNFVHGTNYGGKERTMAAVCNITVAHCAKLQSRWFAIHPGIKQWHNRVEDQLQRQRFITNAFGFRKVYFDRVDSILPQALAWIPQSTVAIITDRAQNNIERDLGDVVQIRLQVHDSLVGQYLTRLESEILPKLHAACLIPVPYSDELIIPVGLKTSTSSWGDCKGKAWPPAVLRIG